MQRSLIIVFVLSSVWGYTQEISRSTITGISGYFDQGSSIGFTIGQPAVLWASNFSAELSSGFQQGDISIVNVAHNNKSRLFSKIFPNPTMHLLNIQFVPGYEIAEYTVQIIDYKGTVIVHQRLNVLVSNSVSVEHLPSGLYMLHIINESGELLDQYKVVKL